jgi:hypothetical protein
MKVLFVIFTLVFMSFSFTVSASGVGAISLFDLMRDYTIASPATKVVYGEIRVIEIETDPITDEISISRIPIRSNGENYKFHLTDKVHDRIIKNIDIFTEGLEIAFRLESYCESKWQLDLNSCRINEVFLTFNKTPYEVPNIERPREITVEDYFSLGVLYENLPFKITGVISSKQINKAATNSFNISNIMTLTSQKNSRRKFHCLVGRSFLSEDDFVRLSRIINESKVGNQATCEGAFASLWICGESKGTGYYLCSSEISVVNK